MEERKARLRTKSLQKKNKEEKTFYTFLLHSLLLHLNILPMKAIAEKNKIKLKRN